MSARVLVLGAGFGGLELSTVLSEEFGDDIEVTLIDRNDAFVLGFSKLDVLFGRAQKDAVQMRYADLAKPGVRFLRETVTAIDPDARRVTTDVDQHEGDVLVVALGAFLDLDATPGLADAGSEFYSLAGAARLAPAVEAFSGGDAIVGACGAPYKCPPAPSECALLLHEALTARGVRDASRISLVLPMQRPVPPSPETSAALVAAFEERGITLMTGRRVASLDSGRGVIGLDDGTELPCDLFLGVPRHRAPDVVVASGMTEDGYVPVDAATLETRFPGVYAIGDISATGLPKAGVFAERAGRAVAGQVIAKLRDGAPAPPYERRGGCYIEYGDGLVARVDVDFTDGPPPKSTFNAPSTELAEDKARFGTSRRQRWFGQG